MTAIYGIIGNPVEHSLSPLMHNTAFRLLEVDAEYRLFPLEEAELKPFFAELRKPVCPIFGLNVTVPYKEAAVGLVDHLTPFAERALSVNTIVIGKDRRMSGYNTDGPGFLAHLDRLGFQPAGKRIAIIGAGGTTRAILAALCLLPERPESIRLYNRTVSRAQELVNDLAQRVDVSCVQIVPVVEDLNVELADLLINTTSVGMASEDPLLIDGDLLHSNMLVYDVIYRPKETPLLAAARRQGATAVNGLHMLFYQGVLAFQHWASVQLDDEIKDEMLKSLTGGEV